MEKMIANYRFPLRGYALVVALALTSCFSGIRYFAASLAMPFEILHFTVN